MNRCQAGFKHLTIHTVSRSQHMRAPIPSEHNLSNITNKSSKNSRPQKFCVSVRLLYFRHLQRTMHTTPTTIIQQHCVFLCNNPLLLKRQAPNKFPLQRHLNGEVRHLVEKACQLEKTSSYEVQGLLHKNSGG